MTSTYPGGANLVLYDRAGEHEARVIPDALITLLGRTGIARAADRIGVRRAERHPYHVAHIQRRRGRGTYGFLLPPLNSFQSGNAGDYLEILGAIADDGFRTNIGLVELTGSSPDGASRFESTSSTRPDRSPTRSR